MHDDLPYHCPICNQIDFDGLAHHLLLHSPYPVPSQLVLKVIKDDPGRCFECFKPFADVDVHYETAHVPSVTLYLGRWAYRETVERGKDGMFVCPWCSEKELFWAEFQACRFTFLASRPSYRPLVGARRDLCP